jgi:NitT/TauT family transport system substrate-binding protein
MDNQPNKVVSHVMLNRFSKRGHLFFVRMLTLFTVIIFSLSGAVSYADDDNKLELLFYANPSATTPQLPLWAAYKQGRFGDGLIIKTELWNDPDMIQTLALGGRGDIWLGHIEGFARAKLAGAPLTVIAVTGWKKFFLLSNDPEVKAFSSLYDQELHFAPTGTPAVLLLKAMLGPDAGRISFVPHEGKELSLRLVQGSVSTALLPEPLVSSVLRKAPAYRLVASLEEEYGRLSGGLPRVPLAGIAFNTHLTAAHPEIGHLFLEAMMAAAKDLNSGKISSWDAMPESFRDGLDRSAFEESLSRDVIDVLPAESVKREIINYLKIVVPRSVGEGDRLLLPNDFIFPLP